MRKTLLVTLTVVVLAGCGGSSWSAREDDPQAVQCMECRGNRTVTKNCPDCNGLGKVWVTVKTPAGSEVRDYSCPTQVTPSCSLCAGSGRMRRDTPANWASPSDPRPFVELGRKKYSERDYPGSIQQLNLALKTDPDCVEALLYRGHVKVKTRDFPGAIEDYSAALRLQRDYADALLGRAHAKALQGDRAAAMADYDKVIELSPKEIYGYSHRGLARFEFGDFKGAVDDFDRCIRESPTPVDFARRGRARGKLKDYARALEDLDRAIRDEPRNALFHAYRGTIRMTSGDSAGAIADWKSAREMARDHDRAETEEEIRKGGGH